MEIGSGGPLEGVRILDLTRLLVDLETRGVANPRELRRRAIEEILPWELKL